MAQPATTPKIEELRFRIKTDPKSRLFFPLAEELRKVGQIGEAEQVLRTGLAHHPTYLSAWVSLGRVLRDQKNDAASIEPLAKALQLDPGNVVAARLLADAYLATGEKLEAVKKYKLVHALLPGDEELMATIAQLERDLNPPPVAAMPLAPFETENTSGATIPAAEEASPFATESIEQELAPFAEEQRVEQATGDVEPMLAAHEVSPFEEPAPTYTSAALEIEAPEGMHIEQAPLAAEVPAELTYEDLPAVAPAEAHEPSNPATEQPFAPPADVADVFAPAPAEEPFAVASEPEASEPAEDFTNTITMADLYARQGLIADARMIYENILLRDPGNHAVREKLTALDAAPAAAAPVAPEPELENENEPAGQAPAAAARDPRIAKLEAWLAKVGRREVSRV